MVFQVDHAAHQSTSSASTLFMGNTVRVKLTGDGTHPGKHLILHSPFLKRALKPTADLVITALPLILKEGEGYDSLRRGLQDIVRQV